MPRSDKIILSQHKGPIKEALQLAFELLKDPTAQFQYRITLLTKIVQDLSEIYLRFV